MKVVDPDWNGAVPYSMVVAPGGKVLFKGNGTLDMLKTRRMILASFPDDDYVGQNAYWNSQVAGSRRMRRLHTGPRPSRRRLTCCRPTQSRHTISSTLYSAPLRPAPTTNQPSRAWTIAMPAT